MVDLDELIRLHKVRLRGNGIMFAMAGTM